MKAVELRTKKIISFRLGGKGHSTTLAELAVLVGLYTAEEVDHNNFHTYIAHGEKEARGYDYDVYWQ